MRKIIFSTLAAGLFLSGGFPVQADVKDPTPATMGEAPMIPPGRAPQFRFDDVSPRSPAIGLYAGAFGGASLAQVAGGETAELDPVFGGNTLSYDMGGSVQPLAGIKLGYTWDMSQVPGYAGDPSAPKFLPTIEFESFYLGFKGSGNLTPPVGVNGRTRFDSAVFSLNGLMKFDFGQFRPYAGAGIGGAYLQSDNSRITVNPGGGPLVLRGSADDWVLTTQGIAGCELMVAEQWGIFAEYKFLVMLDPEFRYNSRYTESFDYIGHHIVNGGFRYYFK
ncbi:MAG: hypothetical protein OHK005_05350 [Candidatus Methylacidiphilales bacterium]